MEDSRTLKRSRIAKTTSDPVEAFHDMIRATNNRQYQKARHLKRVLKGLGWDVKEVVN